MAAREAHSLGLFTRPRPIPATGRDDGFAAIDALVGLMILATTLILAFQAMTTAQDLAAGAVENRRATALLDTLMQSRPSVVGAASGRNAGFDWTVALSPVRTGPGGLQLCSRLARAVSRASRRSFTASTVETCREPQPR